MIREWKSLFTDAISHRGTPWKYILSENLGNFRYFPSDPSCLDLMKSVVRWMSVLMGNIDSGAGHLNPMYNIELQRWIVYLGVLCGLTARLSLCILNTVLHAWQNNIMSRSRNSSPIRVYRCAAITVFFIKGIFLDKCCQYKPEFPKDSSHSFATS